MNCMQFNETDQQVKLEFKDVSYFSSGEGGTSDHSKLVNRDAADQHPMSAITGLNAALDSKQPVGIYLTEEQDPTVPGWAKQPQKPTYTAQEVGALPATTHIPSTAADVNAEPFGAVSQHNVSDVAHSDIRLLIQGLTDRLNVLADSDDTTLDQLSEIVAYIKSNRDLISSITTSKVNVADIVDNLTTNASNKPLSAAQGVALKALIDAITIPDKLPNPNALTFTGAVTGSYDGSAPMSIEIPSGGDGSTGHDITITELASGTIPSGTEKVFTHTGITFGQLNGYKRVSIIVMNPSVDTGTDWAITHNADNTLWKSIALTNQRGYIELRKVADNIWDALFKTQTNASWGLSSSPYAPYLNNNTGFAAGTFMLNFTSTQDDEICIYNKSKTTADASWAIHGMNF